MDPQTYPAMVAKAKPSQSSVGRRPRSTAEKVAKSPPAKQQWYPVSESEDGSAGHDSSTEQVPGGAPSSVLPRRLFAADSYPTGLRVNIYSKANIIGSIAASLRGSPAMDPLLASLFCRLFELPVVRCHNSTKLIGSLLCRQLVTVRTYELWFTFATHPLRFSLHEFRDVTGLNCGAFDGQDSEADESIPSTMWNKLFDTAVGEITVGSVLKMLRNRYLAEEKRLLLALIALVDGVLCCSNKALKLTPKYVEMLSDVESFLAYPWGRVSFLVTLPRFLPPPASKIIKDPLEAMRDRLSQKTTEIPDAANTTNFLDDPTACAVSVTILTVNDIVAVEQDPVLSVHFTVIPDAERLLLVNEAEDSQVTSLVQKLLCGKTFKTEDFPGGDRSFCPKLEVRDAGQDEKGCPIPVHQRNLRPRKAVPVEVEEASSSGNSEEGDPPCSERCTHENKQLRTMNCRSLGMPEGSNHISRKRKASDDPQLRQTFSPDSIGIQTEGPNRKGKKRKTVVTRPDEKKTLSRRRSGPGNEVSMVVHRSYYITYYTNLE
ncbi:hypothetical protein Bca52824_002585 [Brassica carinata]|uniref:DUF1985 domain-containing protein n=1 Tax=Brassica carinata TaxID=52824 RepID=A0A8X8BE07_BRACI|nr:hypothetical protein Bca52824_002585 [Brassica carinata]